MKRKFASFLSALFICTALSGCAKSEITPLSELYQGQITMNGVSYSIPFTLDELDENYTINTFEESECANHQIDYKGKFYALAASPDAENTTVSSINFADDSGFSFGEVRYGNTKNKIEKSHGPADYGFTIADKEMDYYYLSENVTLSIIYKDGKVCFFDLDFNGRMRDILEEAQNLAENE